MCRYYTNTQYTGTINSQYTNFRCHIPGLDNDTYEIQGTVHSDLIHKYIPLDKDGNYDQCHVYGIHQSATEFDNDSRPINASKIKCSAWVYSKDLFHDTFVTKVMSAKFT
jgi:OCT family organic cation transporter-like MFS transporter 4/5